MIKSFRSAKTRKLFDGESVRAFVGIEVQARRRLMHLNAAKSLPDLRLLGGDLHPLQGDRAGQWAIKVMGGWRLVFKFADGDAYDVELVDYH